MKEEKRFTLRMDGELFEKVKARAQRNKRSVAKEIEFILDEAFYTDKGYYPDYDDAPLIGVPIEVDGKPLYENEDDEAK